MLALFERFCTFASQPTTLIKMAATPSVTPAPWSHAINKSDHGPLVSIAAGLMLAGMMLFLIIRLAIRWPWNRLLGWDDGTTVIGSVRRDQRNQRSSRDGNADG